MLLGIKFGFFKGITDISKFFHKNKCELQVGIDSSLVEI
jgi:hypothetical protein